MKSFKCIVLQQFLNDPPNCGSNKDLLSQVHTAAGRYQVGLSIARVLETGVKTPAQFNLLIRLLTTAPEYREFIRIIYIETRYTDHIIVFKVFVMKIIMLTAIIIVHHVKIIK